MKVMARLMAVILILVTLLSFAPVTVSAADYINVASVASTYGIASGSTAYSALSMINNTYAAQLTTAQKQGTVVFMFEGAGNDLSASRRMAAMCVVVKNGSVAYLNRNCSTIPDYPFNPAKNSGTAMPTVKSGIYSFTTVNHNGKYAALNVTNAQVVRHSSQTSYYSGTSTAINVHRRDSNSIAAASASWVNSAGCFLIGQAGTGSSGEYAKFIQAVGIVGSGAAGNATYTSYKTGKIVVDRSFAGSYLTNVGYSSGALSLLGAVDESQPPTQAAVSTDKTSYAANETVTFNLSGNGTTNTLWVYRVDGQWQNYYQNAGSSYQLSFGWEGRYKALVETWNSKGSKISNEVYFQIGKPTTATIKANKTSYTTDDTATFTLTSDGDSNTVWFYYADGTSEYIQNLQGTCTKKFTKTGKVEALVEAWNGVGSFCSEKISFTVTKGSGTTTTTTTTTGKPTSATIKSDKTSYTVGESVKLTFSGNGDTNTLWIYYPNGTSEYYEKAGTSKTMTFNTPGTYGALVETWNGVGSFASTKITFTVNAVSDKPTSATISANKSVIEPEENITLSFSGNGKTNTLWVYFPDGRVKNYPNAGTSRTMAFANPGKYEALVETWNAAGTESYVSQKISFTVIPTKAKVTASKSSVTVGESVTFTMACDGKINDLWIYYPDGSSKSYQNAGSSKSLSFTTPGTYQALVETWNTDATFSVKSEKITFTVKAKATSSSTTSKPTTSSSTTKKPTTSSSTIKPTTSSSTIKPTTSSNTTKPSTSTRPTSNTRPTASTQPTVQDPCEYGHAFIDGSCFYCGEVDPDYVPTHEHTFENGVCTDCGEADPNYVVPPVSSGDQNDGESNNTTGSSRRRNKGESADLTWLLVLIIILMVGGIGVLLFFLLKKKK